LTWLALRFSILLRNGCQMARFLDGQWTKFPTASRRHPFPLFFFFFLADQRNFHGINYTWSVKWSHEAHGKCKEFPNIYQRKVEGISWPKRKGNFTYFKSWPPNCCWYLAKSPRPGQLNLCSSFASLAAN